MKKIIFLDIDGTLIGNTFKLREKNIEAVKQLRKQGDFVFLCTGRPMAYIEKEILDIGFDGYLLSAGSTIIYNDEVLMIKPIDKKSINQAISIFDTYQIPYGLEGVDQYYCDYDLATQNYDHSIEKDEELKRNYDHFYSQVRYGSIKDYTNQPIMKISGVAHNLEEMKIIKEVMEENFHVIEFDYGCIAFDIIQRSFTKADAAKFIIEHLGLEDIESVGIGDSMNDYQLLEYVDTAICYKDACQELKDLSQYYFENPDDDGLYKVLKEIHYI